jgi:hypothetical protein
LAKAGEMMLDEKGAVIAECLGLDIALDEFPKTCAAIDIRAAPSRLGTTEKSKLHRLLPLAS